VERKQSGTPPPPHPPPRGSLATEFVSFAAAKGGGAVAERSFGFGLLFPLLNLLFSALNLFRQSFVFSEVEIEDVKFVHKKHTQPFILDQRFQSRRRFSSSRFAV
jgi:hypothetical protein